MENKELVKVYLSSVEGPNRRGRPLGRWKDRVKEYVSGRGVMGNEQFVKKVYMGSVEGTNRRGRPLRRWEDRVKEYVSERGVRGNLLLWARRKCMDKESEDSSAIATPMGYASGGSEASELLID